MDFFSLEEYKEDNIEFLITSKIEDSFKLDYKRKESLYRSDKPRKEISKDVSAFANSDGGIIIYGIEEEDHVPKRKSFIDGEEYSKEWLENVIQSNINRRISDLKIYPVRFKNDIKKTVYVVKIAPSTESPHMCNDNRYYKRYNFQSVPMEEYEVRSLYDKVRKSELFIKGIYMNSQENEYGYNEEELICNEVGVLIENIGRTVETDYKVRLKITGMNDVSFSYLPNVPNDHSLDDEMNVVLIGSNSSPIFPGEVNTILRFNLKMPVPRWEYNLQNGLFNLSLFYTGGEDQAIYKTKDLKPKDDLILKK